jgi:tetratricopeptide (TPR) repeat protein
LINAIRLQAMILFFLGRVVEAREVIERAAEIFRTSQETDKVAARAAGQDAGVAIMAFMSWVLWVLGDVDTAVARMAEALENAEVIRHAHTQSFAWYYASVLHALRGEPAIARSYAERCHAMAEQHGFRQWLRLSRAIRGVCSATMDPSTGYFDEVEAALGEYQRAGYQLAITAQFVLLCSALLTRNEPEAALDTIDRGLSIMTRNDERCLEAELYRLKARALLARGASDAKVAALLDQAVQTARRQHARSLELRAAIDLARFLMSKGRRAEALNLLGPVYGRFTEGFDTQDLKNAQALLAELSCDAKTLDNHAKEQNS